MMDGEIMYAAFKDALADHAKEHDVDNKPDMLMPVSNFEAIGEDDEPLTVIGVAYHDEILQFLCIVEEGDEIWPAMRTQVFRKPEGQAA